jgi:hypothetical protein
MTPHIRKGDVVTCENGHPLYEAIRDIYRQKIVQASAFRGVGNIPSPAGNDPMRPCPICGAEFHREHGGKLQLHFADGWR